VHVTLRQLRVFETVARRGSFTRAAEELHLAQPTVSVQVKQLADAVRLPLFEQMGKKIFLTEAGRQLYATCRQLFEVWSQFEMTLADLKGMKQGRLRLAVVTTAKYFVPRLLGPFLKRFPGIEVALEVANRNSVVERLVANDDDLYIMGVPPQGLDVETHPFLDNPLVVLARSDHLLAREKRIAFSRLLNEPLVLRERGSGTRTVVERYFADHGYDLRARMELGSNEAIKQAVAGGLGITIMSLHALTLEPMHGQLVVLDVEGFPIERSWFVVYPRGKQLSVVARTFFEYLKTEGSQLAASALADSARPPVPGTVEALEPPSQGVTRPAPASRG
jgi:LysR family transcriptional regulator, low CO2-responsive transcriptional regulator